MENLTHQQLHALADAMLILSGSAGSAQYLSGDELHCLCYFSRAVACSLARISTPKYEFTYGAHGGPFSCDLRDALEHAVASGLVVRTIVGADGEAMEKYLTDDSASATARDLMEGCEDDAQAFSFVTALARCLRFRPVPLVFNAIYREPSLYQAHSQELRIGLPLMGEWETFGTWLMEVKTLISKSSGGAEPDFNVFMSVVVDVLAKASEGL